MWQFRSSLLCWLVTQQKLIVEFCNSWRHDLRLNLPFENLQIIIDFEQGLRNATRRVFPEATNTECWFHFIRNTLEILNNDQEMDLTRAINSQPVQRFEYCGFHPPRNNL